MAIFRCSSAMLRATRWARKLTEQWSAAGWRVFDPASELLPGDNWPLEIGKALQNDFSEGCRNLLRIWGRGLKE